MAKKKNGAVEAAQAAAQVPEFSVEQTWRHTGPEVMRGTACKCGAHTSAQWDMGGSAWLTAHVAEVHPTAFDWPAAIRKALAMPDALDALAFLQTLIPDEEEEKGDLSNA